jgi:hypothetical protein
MAASTLLETLYDEHATALFAFVLNMTRDVLQDGFYGNNLPTHESLRA